MLDLAVEYSYNIWQKSNQYKRCYYFKKSNNKNAFQYDACRPLVTIRGVSLTDPPGQRPPLWRDPPLERPPLWRDPPSGETPWWTETPTLDRTPPRTEPPLWTETPLTETPPGQRPTTPPPRDRQTPLKTLPSRNFICGRVLHHTKCASLPHQVHELFSLCLAKIYPGQQPILAMARTDDGQMIAKAHFHYAKFAKVITSSTMSSFRC